jgi:hypothetical protein
MCADSMTVACLAKYHDSDLRDLIMATYKGWVSMLSVLSFFIVILISIVLVPSCMNFKQVWIPPSISIFVPSSFV